jgi:hypothetical protein
MCRYASSGPYKTHYACFSCRKAFKQPPIGDYFAVRGQRPNHYAELSRLWSMADKENFERLEQQLGIRLSALEAEYREATRKCPECGEPMVDMGLDFKTPRQADVKAWRMIQGLYRTGHQFRTCGCNGPGWIPSSSADYQHYLESMGRVYAEQVRYAQDRNDLSPERKREAAEFWQTRIDAIERERKAIA